ncbi:MAG: nickel pincer cofactor biosynthesis protein LarB [Christensenellales bacterium]|jgi:NCAIR mutase (PurE)-related protein
MKDQQITELLEQVKDGQMAVEEAQRRLQDCYFEDLGYAKVDHNRPARTGFAEVVYCQGKTPQQAAGVFGALLQGQADTNILGTRAGAEHYQRIYAMDNRAVYHEAARIIEIRRSQKEPRGNIMVLTAGTSDIAVAEEAAVTARAMGRNVTCRHDVGVAGIHRLLAYGEEMRRANVLVVIAGMEGALASVVGGLVASPVIAVPTSVGYGANFGGVSALLTMLNSCSSGVSVVNIDNGFGAGYLAAMIDAMADKEDV